MLHKQLALILVLFGILIGLAIVLTPLLAATYTVTTQAPVVPASISSTTNSVTEVNATTAVTAMEENISSSTPAIETVVEEETELYHQVPFYSQFSDITATQWQKVGCGIASVAMLIDFYSDEPVNVDRLLEQGLQANAYLDNAGWTHNGLIQLSTQFDLGGKSHSLAHLTMQSAFAELKHVLEEGPVMASVHYTFQPTNPIPHLVVVTGIDGDRVYFNDPADLSGQNSISINQFQSAWKKRYISIRPAV